MRVWKSKIWVLTCLSLSNKAFIVVVWIEGIRVILSLFFLRKTFKHKNPLTNKNQRRQANKKKHLKQHFFMRTKTFEGGQSRLFAFLKTSNYSNTPILHYYWPPFTPVYFYLWPSVRIFSYLWSFIINRKNLFFHVTIIENFFSSLRIYVFVKICKCINAIILNVSFIIETR